MASGEGTTQRERAGDGGRGGVTPTEGAAPPGPKAARTWTAAGVSGAPAPAFAGTTFPSAFVGLSPGVASARPPVSITGWSERPPGSLHGTQRASARSREAARGGRAGSRRPAGRYPPAARGLNATFSGASNWAPGNIAWGPPPHKRSPVMYQPETHEKTGLPPPR